MEKRRGAWRGSRRLSRAPGCPVFKVLDDESPRALADGWRQRLYRGEVSPSPPCRFGNVIEAFAHCRRLRAHLCRVVWVEPIVIQLRLTGATRALIVISNVYTRACSGCAWRCGEAAATPLLDPMAGTIMVASILQHAFRPLCAV